MLKSIFYSVVLLIPFSCLSAEISIGGGIQLPLGEKGSELPVGNYLDLYASRDATIKPLIGVGFSTLGIPDAYINLYRIYIGLRYKIFEVRGNCHMIKVNERGGYEREIGVAFQTGILFPLGNGGCYANLFYTSIPNGVGLGIVFNILRM